jgi:diacylglycerol O-acyltransferase / wax synthase
MRQLSSLDAQFLAMENPRQTGHVAGLGIYDTSTAPSGQLTAADMKQLLADRLHLLPPLRWRLVDVPFGADYPYWIDDPDFDFDFHVRELALPSPGDEQQLAEQIARLHSRPLDRARPLWELYVISGLRDGHTAVYTKIHHAVIDGVSGAEITGMLLDLTPEVRRILPEQPRTPSSPPFPAPRRWAAPCRVCSRSSVVANASRALTSRPRRRRSTHASRRIAGSPSDNSTSTASRR